MEFGIVYPGNGEYVDPELAVRCASLAEEFGFGFFLTWDHYMYPSTSRSFDAWVFLTHIASKTERIRIGTCVTPIPFRPPGMLAKMVATLDVLSKGRVILGVGAGWNRPEFDGFSTWDEAGKRVSKVKEGVQLMTRLWSEPSVDFEGEFYRAKGAVVEPKPVQRPHPKLWFGGTGNRMLRLAAELGDGWIPTMISPDEYRDGVSRLNGLLPAAKREKGFSFVYDLFEPLQSAREYADSIQKLRDAGCERYAINWKYGKESLLDRLRWFVKEVRGSFS